MSTVCSQEVTACFTSASAENRSSLSENHWAPHRSPDWLLDTTARLWNHRTDFAPSDLFYFGPLTRHLAGKRFSAEENMKQAATSCLQAIYTISFYGGMQASVPRRDKCWNVKGDTWRCDAYRLLLMYCVYIETEYNSVHQRVAFL